MASILDRLRINVPGTFYNDSTCIDCGICPEMAPSIFRRDDGLAQSYVWRQPASPDEEALAREVQASCPTDSIGSDG